MEQDNSYSKLSFKKILIGAQLGFSRSLESRDTSLNMYENNVFKDKERTKEEQRNVFFLSLLTIHKKNPIWPLPISC